MERLEVRFKLGVDELLDAAEGIELLLDRDADGDLSPALRDLLFTLDETLTEAYRGRAPVSVPVTVDDAVSAL